LGNFALGHGRSFDAVRIAMDGSFLRLPPSGTAAYIRGLYSGFDEMRADLDLHLLDRERPASDPLGEDRLTCPTKPMLHDSRLDRARWELFGVSRKAKDTQAQLLHMPHFSAPLRPGMPLIVTIHDLIPLLLPEYRASAAMRAHLTIIRRTVKQARMFLTPSQAAANDIRDVLRFPEEKIRITPEAADSKYVPPPSLEAAKELVRHLGIDGPYVFNVGGLDVRKNLPLLIQAFAEARPRLASGTKLFIAGAPHSKNLTVFPPLEPVISTFGLQELVLLLGRVSEEDKLLLYQAADLYVTPSIYEGFGLTALEAMACGVPTIAANRTSLPEVVGDGGLMVEPEVHAIAQSIVDVLTNAELAKSLQQKALARAKQFSWRRTAELTIDTYREALAASTKS
jgi:glycosyltransferase involved in cell wall biosynthesis